MIDEFRNVLMQRVGQYLIILEFRGHFDGREQSGDFRYALAMV